MENERSSGIGLVVEGADEFRAELTKANSAIRMTDAEIKKLDATYGKGATNSDYLTQRTQKLTQQLESQKEKTAILRKELADYEATGGTSAYQLEKRRLAIIKSETAEANLQRQINEANDALKEHSDSARMGETAEKGLEKQVEKTSKEIVRQGDYVRLSGETLDDYAKKASRVGDSLTRALTLPIAGMGTYTLNAAMELEDAMKTVATLPGVVGGSVEQQAAQLEAYTDAIREASDVTHVAAEDLAAAQYQAISAGTAAADSVELVERSAKAAKAGLTDVSTVVDGATSILNAWKDTAGGIDHVLDAMIVAQNEGKTTVGDLASQIGQVTGLAPALGVALDEVLAAVAALTKGGVQTSSAINGLKAVFSNVMKPTAEAREEAERLGLQFDAAALQAQGFTGFLESVMDATKGDSESLAKLFGSVEGLSQIMALGTTQAEEYARILNVIGSSTGAVDEAFAVRTSSKAEQLSGSLNKLRNSGSQLAENLFPAVDAVTDLIGGAADVIGDMDEGTQKALVNILGVTAAIGPTTKAVSGLTSAVSKLIPLLSGPWGLAAAGAIAVGGLTLHLVNANSTAKRLEETVGNMEFNPDTESLSGLSGRLQAAIDSVDKTKIIAVTANVTADYTGVDAAYDEVTSAIQRKLDATMEDLRVTWQEYAEITSSLNGEDMLGYAQKVYRTGDGEMSAIAEQMIGAIDDANALLRKMYTSGESVTEAEVEQLNVLLGQITEYRLKLTGAWEEAEDFAQTVRAEMNAALEDNRLSLEEYEAIKHRIDEEVRPDAVAAMEDAATASIGSELDSALTELDELLAAIYERGGDAAEGEIARINQLLAEIEAIQAQIDALQGAEYARVVRSMVESDSSYALTVAGQGTAAMATDNFGLIIGATNVGEEQIEQKRQALEDEYKAAAIAAVTEEEMKEAIAAYESGNTALDAEKEALLRGEAELLSEAFAGWAKGEFGDSKDAKAIEDLGRVIEELSELTKAGEAGWFTHLEWFLGSDFARTEEGRRVATAAGLYREDGSLISTPEEIDAWYEYASNDQYDALMEGVSKWQATMTMLLETFNQQYQGNYGDGSLVQGFLQEMINGGLDLNSLDVTQLDGVLADVLRLKLLGENGMDALGSEAMEAIGSGIVEAAPEAVEDAEQAAADISGAATNLQDGTAAGRALAASLAAGIVAGTPAAVAAAYSLVAQVDSALAGMQTHAPGATLSEAAAGAGSSSNSYDFSTNVSFGTGIFTGKSDIDRLREGLNTAQRLKMAGVGQVARA